MPDCPMCGRPMEVFDGRERTVGGLVWVTLWCPSCCHTEDDTMGREDERRRDGAW